MCLIIRRLFIDLKLCKYEDSFKVLIWAALYAPFGASAQDWQCLRTKGPATYVDTADLATPKATNTMWVVNTDSVRLQQGWTNYCGFQVIRYVSGVDNTAAMGKEYCYDPFGPSRMGCLMAVIFLHCQDYGKGIYLIKLFRGDVPIGQQKLILK
jgi:hypothetical protein